MDRDGFDTRDRAAYFHAVVAETKDVEKNGRKLIVGVVMYHFKYSTWVGQVVHLGNIAVDPQFQRKGVATKLMQHIGQVEILLIIILCLENDTHQKGNPIVFYIFVDGYWEQISSYFL